MKWVLPDKIEAQEERKYTIFECIINFANLICLSIESFDTKKPSPDVLKSKEGQSEGKGKN